MESENNRSYRRSGSELFICFTSRNSSSIKVCSKSAQSPGRNSGKFSNNNSSSSSLSCSLSRRLRSNGSIKGSPMFPSGSQKKKGGGGSSSETTTATTAEPSSPKVTCIGQVRVKTKKQGQKFRKKKSKRRDVSFRKTDQDGSFHSQPLQQQQQQQQQQECLPHRNQRWVHLPLSICEALRAFGAEFSCLLPCKPSCLTRGMKKKRRQTSSTTERNTSSCRQTFEKWVMTNLHETSSDNRDHHHHHHNNERELVVSRREEEMVGEISEEKRVSICNQEEEVEEDEEDDEEEEEKGRVSICAPPRNALLLMRCRSEPLRMSSLANHFWESPVKDKKEEEEDLQIRKQVLVAEEDGDNTEDDSESDEEDVNGRDQDKDSDDDEDDGDGDGEIEDEHQDEVQLQVKIPEEDKLNVGSFLEEHHDEENQEEIVVEKIEEDVNENGCSSIEPLKEEEQEILVIEENEEEPKLQIQQEEEEEKELTFESKEERVESKRPSTSSRRASFSSCARSSIHEDEDEQGGEQLPVAESEPAKVVNNNATDEKATKPRISVEKRGTMKINNKKEELPDCLLLMMCEPKLSMEVSKETWVCSTDFIRYRPERKVVQNNGGGGGDHDRSKKRNSTDSKGRHSLDSKNRLSTDSKGRHSLDSKGRHSTDSNPGNGRPPLHGKHQKPPTPPRRSLSKPIPPPPSVAKSTTPAPPPPPAKLVPPVEVSTTLPSATPTMIERKLVNAVVLTRCKSEPMRSSAKLAPEACFWKNMKLEPHSQGPPNLGPGAAATGIGF